MSRGRTSAREGGKKAAPLRPSGRRKRAAAALDLAALTSLMGVHLRLANVALYQDFTDAVSPLDITQRQSAVLILIGTNPGASQIALAEFLGINRATMMSMVNRLQDRELLERREMHGDRRLRGLYLTRKGERTLAELKRRIQRHERRMFERFSSAERQQLVRLLSRVHGKL